ncbi:unnamed protein product [Soboliphyme baturini]|uniref:Nucleotid_trans domain-containing protein n=1 Tax=Soboliphyme baturini TaxID=241478 RepID=A0A183J896_9BILA|nr:unnamed protein product [Soboliphyme baturini]
MTYSPKLSRLIFRSITPKIKRLVVLGIIAVVSVSYFLARNSSYGAAGKDIGKTSPLFILEQPMSNNYSAQNPTIVTGFIDIGKFIKGSVSRQLDTYLEWFKVWSKIRQPVVFYFDKKWIYTTFSRHRRGIPTKYIYVNMFQNEEHWSWKLLQKTKRIFAQENYPQHHPPTTNAHYSVIMHGKYEFLENAIDNNYFHSPYIMWLDIGLFRDYRANDCFKLKIPPNFNDSKIAFNKVKNFIGNKSSEWIIRNMPFWLCGCILVGRVEVMKKFIRQYRLVRDVLMERNLTGDDQMILYSMFSDYTLGVSLNVDVQTYEDIYRNPSYVWFYLGYAMKSETPCVHLNHTSDV